MGVFIQVFIYVYIKWEVCLLASSGSSNLHGMTITPLFLVCLFLGTSYAFVTGYRHPSHVTPFDDNASEKYEPFENHFFHKEYDHNAKQHNQGKFVDLVSGWFSNSDREGTKSQRRTVTEEHRHTKNVNDQKDLDIQQREDISRNDGNESNQKDKPDDIPEPEIETKTQTNEKNHEAAEDIKPKITTTEAPTKNATDSHRKPPVPAEQKKEGEKATVPAEQKKEGEKAPVPSEQKKESEKAQEGETKDESAADSKKESKEDEDSKKAKPKSDEDSDEEKESHEGKHHHKHHHGKHHHGKHKHHHHHKHHHKKHHKHHKHHHHHHHSQSNE